MEKGGDLENYPGSFCLLTANPLEREQDRVNLFHFLTFPSVTNKWKSAIASWYCPLPPFLFKSQSGHICRGLIVCEALGSHVSFDPAHVLCGDDIAADCLRERVRLPGFSVLRSQLLKCNISQPETKALGATPWSLSC